MKEFLTKASRLLLTVSVCFCLFSPHFATAGGLSGAYTIGSSGTYPTFSKAVAALTTNGVSGAVTFNVAAGTYNEQVTIGKITGASATNTISFVGQSDSSKVILTYASSSSSTSDYTLELNASRYVTFQKMTITRSGTATYLTSVLLTGGTFHCQFQSCLITTQLSPATSVAAGEPCVYITSADTGDVFNGNRIKHGYNCLCFGAAGYTNVVSNNIIDSGGMAGLYVLGDYEVDLLVAGNTFNAGTVTVGSNSSTLAYGVRFETSAAESFTITKNKFYATSTTASTCRCLVIFTAGWDGTNRNLIANNFFWVSAGTSASTGITLGGGTNIDIDYNNVLMTSTPTTPGSALYIYSTTYAGSGITLRDNNLICKGGCYCIDNENDSASSGITTGLAIEDYNNLYTTYTYTAFYRNTKYSSLSAYQSACKVSGAEGHSIAADPGYKSTSAPYYDLHESSGAVYQAGTPVAHVTTDIDGNPRPSTKPCIGACEFTPVYVDAGVTVIDSPATYCYPVTKDVVVQFTDFGLNTITGVILNWSVNGSTQSPVLWSGSLASAQTSAQITLGTYAFSAKTPYTLKIWTSQPNSSTDQNHSNDTLTKIVQSGLSGTYYLGGTSPDFTSFNGALGAINAYGICGPTVIRVRNGTYAEQLTVPNFPSMSSTNTVTFQSDAGDSSKVILTQATSTTSAVGVFGNNSTMQLNAAKWFTFKQITIQKTGTLTTQNVVQLLNGANNNSFQNCRFIGVLGSTTTNSNTGGDIIWSDSTTTTTETNNTFTNNAFKYGYSAFDLIGQQVSRGTGLVVSGNKIDSTYGPGIILSNEDAATVTNNSITNITGGASYAGIQLTRCKGAISLMQNRVRMPYGATSGIYLLYCAATSGAQGTIANNYVSINSTASPKGIFDSSSVYQNFYFNTVDIYGANTGTCFYLNAASGNVSAVDNLWYNAGGGYAIKVPVTTSGANGNYNDMFTTGTNLGLWGTTKAASLSAWQTASGAGANSVSINPQFISNTDYKTFLPALIGLGTPISGITTDIGGNTRSATHPAMGAWEIHLAANEAGVSSISNPSGATICGGPTPVTVVLNNYGSAALTSATLGWSVNGTAQTAYSFSGNISAGSSATVTVGTYNFASGTAKLKVWSSLPNGIQDSLPSDDTTSATYSVNPAPVANAGSNATVCAGTSVSIGATAVTGDTYSWTSSPTDASITSTTSSNPTVTPTSTTSYTLTETITSTGCSLSNPVTITVNALPAAAAGVNSTICAGQSASIGGAAVSGSSYTWVSNPSGFSTTASSASVSPATTTAYTITETNSNSCVASNSVTVTVNALPAALVASSSSICPGNTVSIGGTAVTGSSYSWVSNPTGFSSTSSNPSVSPTSTTSYTLTEINANSCSASNSLTITVNPIPSANAGSPATICAGNSIQIGGSAVLGNTYAWTATSGFTSTSSNPVVIPSTTTTYTLVESVSSGCSNTHSVTITVNALPAANAGSTSAICSGKSVSIGAAAVSGDTYSWTSNPSGYSSTASSASVTPTATTVYYLTEKNPTTRCSNTNSVLITVNPLPAAYAGSAVAVCSGSPVTSIGGTSVTGDAYSWSPTTGLSSATVSNPTVNLSATTTYTLTETISATGCTNSNSVTATYNTSPAASTGVSQAICAGSSASIGASAVSGDTYSWSPASGLSSPSVSSPTASPSTTTTYALTEKVSATGCATTNTITITVNALPAANVGANPTIPVCLGSSTTIGGASVLGSLYTWTSKPKGFTSTVSNPTISPLDTTVYTLTEKSVITGCSNTNTLTVDVINLPVATVTTSPVCIGSRGVVVATNAPGNHYTWYLNGVYQPKDTGFRIITSLGGAYSATVTNTITGCSANSNVADFVVNALPNTEVKTIGSNVGCTGDSLVMIAPLDSNDNYQWLLNGKGISGANNYIYIARQTGNYQLLVSSILTKCSDTSTAIPVTINSRPVVPVSILGPTTVCSGQGVGFRTTSDTGVTYSWYQNNVAIAGTDTNNFSATSSGDFSVQVTYNATGCSQMSSVVPVTVNPLPLAEISAAGNTNLCPGSSVFLIAGTDNAYTYRWQNDSGYLAGESGDTITVTKAANYSVTVENGFGCKSNSNAIAVTAASYPKVSIIRPAKTTYCQDTVTLTTLDSNVGAYQWYMNGNIVAGDTDSSIVVTQTGLYTVQAKGSVTCVAHDTISITDNSLPVPAFSLSSNDTFCTGTGLRFYNQSSIASGTMSYIWTFGNGDSSTNASPSYAYSKPGTFYVQLIAQSSAGCTSVLKDSLYSLAVDSSSFNTKFEGGRLIYFTAHVNDSNAKYIWDFGDGKLASGATTFYEYGNDGDYRVTLTVINANGCSSSTTSTITVKLSGFEQTQDENLTISVFPNPFKTQTTVLYTLKQNSSVEIEAFDINGKRVAHVENTTQPAGDHSYVFNGSVPGTYFIRMIVDGQPFVSRVVQQ